MNVSYVSFDGVFVAALTLDLLILVLAVLNTGKEDGGLVGEDETILLEIGVSGVENGVEHGLVEKEVAHPLRDDDVDLGKGKLNLLHLALEKSDLVGETVGGDDFTSLEDDGRHIDTNNVLSTSLGGEPVVTDESVFVAFFGRISPSL